MKYLMIVFLAIGTVSCKQDNQTGVRSYAFVTVEDIYVDSVLSIRAIEILNDKSLAFAANNGVFGLFNPTSEKWMASEQKHDSLSLQFRSVAHTSTDFFMLGVGNPALLYKTGDEGVMELVYKEVHEKVFYDSMAFWNDNEGIAIGDTTTECLSIIVTRDGGQSWSKLSCDILPKGMANEGAFAASNTNIAIVGDKTWIGTTAGRVYFSPDKGKSWKVFDTPIVKESDTEGIYSIVFYDDLNGFAIGGDYTDPNANSANKIRTKDGGKTWEVVSDNQEPGYRSCVQYVPGSNANSLVAIGFKGIDFSNDKGTTWKHLSDEGFYTIRFFNDSTAYAAGSGRISKLVFSE